MCSRTEVWPILCSLGYQTNSFDVDYVLKYGRTLHWIFNFQFNKSKFAVNEYSMKGVNYVTDGSNKKVAVQIEIKLLEKYEEQIEDLIDGIIAESRKDEERKPLNDVIKNLKRKGKLK